MKTVNLPQTTYPMRANLPALEKSILEQDPWISTSNNTNGSVVHDGPPYANGNIHIGHAYNKILKDTLVRYLSFANPVNFVCGWDCHGLPIELAVKKQNENLNPDDLQQFREYASNQMLNQASQFAQLGVVIKHTYTTMAPSFEDDELRCFQELVKKNLVSSRNKPVHWCWSCETSLADHEIDYQDVTDNSVYVLFRSNQEPKLAFLVWTTTPWTLKANKAIAINKNIQYVVVCLPETQQNVVVSKWFAENKLGLESFQCQTLNTESFINTEFLDPFEEDMALRKVFHADYVTEETGTGLVHIAPSCGKEDYLAMFKFGRQGSYVVDPYTDSKGRINGVFYKKANKLFVDELLAKGNLWKQESSQHSYPFCWRCHNPTIQRATKQVFLDYESKKELIFSEAEKINFYPAKSKNRFMSFVLSRTEWCVSRQRKWGVPIPEYVCEHCESDDFDLNVKTVEQWRDSNYRPTCSYCGSGNTKKGTDILDVWFDSGVTYRTLKNKKSDWVIEGSDQHRGWFQSSHILSCLLEGETCFTNIVSHGFVLDEKGRKMSKSLGNVVDPLDVANKHGVEIFRLWSLSQQVGDDVLYSNNTLETQKNHYRKIRNTLRYLHGNLYDYKFRSGHPNDKELDKLEALKNSFHACFQRVEYYKFLQALMGYIEELSANFIDNSKTVLYESEANSQERRDIQETYFVILHDLMNMLDVILPFTMFELREHIAKNT